ncbi:hemagglutinin repeat-containing protein [Kalamiella sp. sgz302252]|uniref:two-partner secretion domain-containing protein n=1 Tax=Pantoea sp. sgz302252 TaxID=3341827 RepID=UPI0036D2ABED
MNYKKIKFITKRKRYLRLKPLVLAMSAVIPVSAAADIIIDPDKKHQENLASAANGTPVININNANGQGVSHNKYADFNVERQGVIFNNSMQDGVSKTGGFVIKNSNLSSEAKVILNEVTGARGSQLAGSMEVFGRTADLIVANENGITVNGVSTVNANSLTLSTGRVNFDQNGGVQLAVERGAVSIEGQGINTDGLSYFDIVSRSAKLTGEIAGQADIKILTGPNDYNTTSRTHSVRSGNGTTDVAISGSQLGSMYGNRIQLISTESGAGVTHQGSIIGSKGIEISADGEISLASVVSDSDSVTIAGRSITLAKYADQGGISAQSDVVLTALTNMAIGADIVAGQGTIRINANSLLQSAANLLARNGTKSSSAVPAIQIQVADRYFISGTLYAVDGNNNRIDGAQIVLSQGKFVVKVNGKTMSNAAIVSDASITSVSGDIAVSAGFLQNSQGVITAQKGSLIFNLDDALVNDGYVQANGSVSIAGKRLKNGGIINTTSGLKLTLGTLENSGTLYADRVVVTASKATNEGIILSEQGDIDLQIQDELNNSGTLQANSAVKVKTKNVNNSGVIASVSDTELTTDSLVNSGTIQGKNVSSVSEKLTNTGNVLATSGDIKLQINGDEKALNRGTIQAGNTITLQGKTLHNEGGIAAQQGALNLELSNQLDNSGVLYGKGIQIASDQLVNSGEVIAEESHLSLNVQGSESVINTGVIQAQSGQIAIQGELNNQGTIAAQNELMLSAEKISNHSDILSYGDMQLRVASELTNAGDAAIISAAKTLTMTGEQPGTLVVNNSDGGVIQSTKGNIDIHSLGSLNNDMAKIQASGMLNIVDASEIVNTDGQLSGGNVNLLNIERVKNQGADAVIVAQQSLAITNIDQLDNMQGNISSWQDITFSNIKELNNSSAEIIANNMLKFEEINSLINSDGATISSLYKNVLFNAVENISNVSGALIEANEQLSFYNTSMLNNSDDSLIQSFGDIQLDEIGNVDNAGAIMANASLLLKNVNVLVNKGEFALLQGLDIVLEKVKSIVNRDYAAILADDSLKINEANTLLNEAAAFIQANTIAIATGSLTNTGYESQIVGLKDMAITAKEVNNSAQAGIFSEESLSIVADTINNALESDINAASYQLSAAILNNKGVISSGNSAGESLIDVKDLNNASGVISNTGSLTVNTTNLNNSDDGRIFAGKALTLNKVGDYNNAEGSLASNTQLNINATGDVVIDKAVESFAAVNISANNIYNNESIVSASDIYLKASNIVNNVNSLIYSMGNSILIASEKISNLLKGNILSQQNIVMEAESIYNQAGVIRSEGNMWLDAKNLLNESTYKGVSWDYSAYENGTESVEEEGPTWGKTHSVTVNIPGLASNISLDIRAEISAGNNLYINQDSASDSIVNNKGGLIQAANDIYVKGHLYNAPDYLSITMADYLKTKLSKEIVFNFFYWKSLWTNGNPSLYFSSVYEMLDFLYGNGDYRAKSEVELDSNSRSKFSNAIRELASKHVLLNELMNKIFGEQWKSSKFEYMQSRWAEVNQEYYINPPSEFETGSKEKSSKLEDMKIYFLPAAKASISAGGNFVHTGGTMNNGIASEVTGELQENKVVTVTVGDQEVTTLEQGYEVKFNKKNIEEIAKGISTLPTIGKLTDIKGLFEKSQDFIDYLNALSSGSSSVQAADAEVQAGTGAAYKVVAMYETRPSMIDQNQYYGSDYFFNAVGYKSEQPVLVIGDNYFISELIRRQATESLGPFMSEKYQVEGAALVQLLFDNAAELVAGETGEAFIIGQALSQEQIDNLEQDIVWFVSEHVDGIEVLVPKIYLSNKTLQEVKVASETGAATIHAGKNVIVDATAINNNNAEISAGKDISLVAENNINNISSGMNSGIKAGGSAYLISESGDITNSGSAIDAGENIALVAREGNIDLIASVGRNETGNQQISAYDDGISAGGSIDILAKEVNITGIALSAGDVAKETEKDTPAAEPELIGLHKNSSAAQNAEAEKTSDSYINIVSTEGNVNFNDIHEVSSAYSYDFQSKDFGFTTRTEETTEAAAKSKTSSINTDGAFIVNAAQDVVFTGGTYNAGVASISADNDIITKTSQDHDFKEVKVTETSLDLSLKVDLPIMIIPKALGLLGVSETSFLPDLNTDISMNSLKGKDTKEAEFQSQGQEGSMSNSNSKRPGAAALSDSFSFSAGMKTTEETTTTSSVTNTNASFNFSNGVNMTAGNTLDIGGMDLTVGDIAVANLSGKNIISTKYEDVSKSTTTTKETFTGVKAEAHSSVLDAIKKQIDRDEKKEEGVEVKDDIATDKVKEAINNADVKTDVGLTAAEYAGDATNIGFNDLIGGSFSLGTTTQENTVTSETRTENINSLYGGQINFNSGNDTNLKGVDAVADEINFTAGGNLMLSAAQSTYTSSSSDSFSSDALAASAGVSLMGAGAGGSYDKSGSKNSRDTDATAYANASFDANQVNVNIKGDMDMSGANITAGAANINVGGDLAITSVQDTYVETANGTTWGVSAGAAISTSGILPTLAANGGGGSENHNSSLTQQQSGIKTTNEVNIVTGGDLNLTGGHIVSETQQGSVDVAGTITANDLKDELHSGGAYGGGGGGINSKGLPTVNGYYNKLDTIDYEESQHSTINVGITNGEVSGNLNTDANKTSTVDQVDVTAGNNISFTLGLPKFGFSSKGSSKSKNTADSGAKSSRPTVSDSSSSATQKPGSSSAATPTRPGVSDSSSSATQKPGSSSTATPTRPGVSDSSSSATQKPGSSSAATPTRPGVSDSSSTATQKPGVQPVKRPNTATVTDSTSSATTETAKRPTATDTVDSGATTAKPATKWPTVQPVKPIVGGTGSASRPSGINNAGSAKPANNSPIQNGETAKTSQNTAADTGAKATQPVTKWPTVQPVKPIVGGTGSASRPSGINSAGSAKPANNSPIQNGETGKVAGSASEARVTESAASEKTVNNASQSDSAKGSTGTKVTPPAAKWPTVQPAKPIVGGTGSASRPGGNNNSGAAKPANSSPKAESLANKEQSQTQNSGAANQQSETAKWKVLMDNQTVEKPKNQ